MTIIAETSLKVVGALHTILDYIPQFAGALFTLIIGSYFFQKYFIGRANEASRIDAIIKEIEALRVDALEYWGLSPDTKAKREKIKMLEQKVKGSIRSLTSSLREYSGRYCKKTDYCPWMAEVRVVLREIFASGQQYSSKSRCAPRPGHGRTSPPSEAT